VLDESVAVLAEDGVIPHGVLDSQTYEPAEQRRLSDLLAELPLAAHAVQHLQQHCAHELLRRDIGRSGRLAGTKSSRFSVVSRLAL
jgi:hypothetical protein